jgi:putative zinc finger protein
MALTCKEIWREVSNYVDNTLSPNMRKDLELHISRCRHCAAVIDGVHNVIVLAADERIFVLPAGFDARLQSRLKREL